MAKIKIDLGNSPKPNWRYVTGIVNGNDLSYSIYSINALNEKYIEQCKNIYPNFNFKLE